MRLWCHSDGFVQRSILDWLGRHNAASGTVTPGTWSSSTPYPAQWLTSTMLEYGVETWHLGVLCLLGNCLLVAAYLVIQVMQISELALDPAFSLVDLIFIDQIIF